MAKRLKRRKVKTAIVQEKPKRVPEMRYRDELRSIPLWGLKTFHIRHFEKVKVTKSVLKNKFKEGEWIIIEHTKTDFTLQRIK